MIILWSYKRVPEACVEQLLCEQWEPFGVVVLRNAIGADVPYVCLRRYVMVWPITSQWVGNAAGPAPVKT